jgi:dolichol-phosphate mannosyltransferase
VDRYLSKVRPDHVVNAVRPGGDFAAGHREMFETIVVGTHNLLAASAAAGCQRFVQFGSAAEYGDCDGAIDESLAPMPQTAFGGAKAAATMLSLAAGRTGAMASVVLRPFMVYGPRDVPTRLVPTIARSALDGTELALTSPGYRRDWVFVADVADACVAALSGGADGQVVNLGTGLDHDSTDVVRLVERITGRSLTVRLGAFAPRPWDRAKWSASTARARMLLGWEARTMLEEGLRKTLAWARETAPASRSARAAAPGLRN